jgi:hypothetical protein
MSAIMANEICFWIIELCYFRSAWTWFRTCNNSEGVPVPIVLRFREKMHSLSISVRGITIKIWTRVANHFHSVGFSGAFQNWCVPSRQIVPISDLISLSVHSPNFPILASISSFHHLDWFPVGHRVDEREVIRVPGDR